jgi:hypothetical protein
MPHLTVSTEPTQPPSTDAALGQVIAAVNALIAKLGPRERVSPSVPLDAPHPSASIVCTDEECDALLSERLEARAAPNERLRQTLSSRPPRR